MPAGRLELPRQKVNYHLKELERHGLVELAEERRKGNVTERVYRAIAASYVISPSVLAAVSPDPSRSPDQLSAHWLLALGSRLAQEVGTLLTSVSRAERRVATSASTPRCGSPRRPPGRPSPRNSPGPWPPWSAATTTSPPPGPQPPGGRRTAPDPRTAHPRPEPEPGPSRGPGPLGRSPRRTSPRRRRRTGHDPPVRNRTGDDPPGEAGAGLGGDRHRTGHRLLVHGAQRTRPA